MNKIKEMNEIEQNLIESKSCIEALQVNYEASQKFELFKKEYIRSSISRGIEAIHYLSNAIMELEKKFDGIERHYQKQNLGGKIK